MIGTLGSTSSKPSSLSAQHLPDWLEHGVESSLRDTEIDDPVSGPMFAAPVALSSQQAKASAASTPIVLTPRGGSSPQPSKNGGVPSTKGAWKDLDKFYEDTEEVEVVEDGEESGEDDDEDGGDDDEEESGEDDGEDEDGEDGDGEEAVIDERHQEGSTQVEDDSSEDESDSHSGRGLLNPP